MHPKLKRLLRVIIVLFLLGLAGYYVKREFDIDRCLDASGGWDFEKNECDRS